MVAGKRFSLGAQKRDAAVNLYSHLLSDARLRRELFAEVDKGRWQSGQLKGHKKILPSSLADLTVAI
ncbi:hypothetical protein ACNKHS_16955 [Shigella flexneri]